MTGLGRRELVAVALIAAAAGAWWMLRDDGGVIATTATPSPAPVERPQPAHPTTEEAAHRPPRAVPRASSDADAVPAPAADADVAWHPGQPLLGGPDAIRWLALAQNADGGWGASSGAASDVVSTGAALFAIGNWSDDIIRGKSVDVQPILAAGRRFLGTRRTADGRIGETFAQHAAAMLSIGSGTGAASAIGWTAARLDAVEGLSDIDALSAIWLTVSIERARLAPLHARLLGEARAAIAAAGDVGNLAPPDILRLCAAIATSGPAAPVRDDVRTFIALIERDPERLADDPVLRYAVTVAANRAGWVARRIWEPHARAAQKAQRVDDESSPDVGSWAPGGGGLGASRIVATALSEVVAELTHDEYVVASGLEALRVRSAAAGGWADDAAGDPSADAPLDPLTTGLALVTFSSAGESHQAGPFREVVRDALKALRGSQAADGALAPRTSPTYARDHAIAALAMTQTVVLTGSKVWKEIAELAVRRAVEDLLAERDVPAADALETGAWRVLLLYSARNASIEVDRAADERVIARLTSVPSRPLGDESETLRAAASAVACLLLRDDAAGAASAFAPLDALVQANPAAILANEPACFFATIAAYRIGGPTWKRWEAAITKPRSDAQSRTLTFAEYGTWPAAAHGLAASRARATALCELEGQIHYRYTHTFAMPVERK